MKKKWGLAVLGLIVVLLLVLQFAFNFSTAFYQNVIAPNPVQDYARSQNLPENIVSMLGPLDSNHEMDSSKKAIVDRIVSVMDYVNDFDNQTQTQLLDAFLGDANLTAAEAHQIHFLETLPKAALEELMQNGNFTNFDLNGDGMNNYFEKNIANLPYADLPTGRWALIVDTFQDQDQTIADNLESFLVIQERFDPAHIVRLAAKNATISNFAQAVSELSPEVGANDILYISLNGHGGNGTFCFDDGYGSNDKVKLSYSSINEVLGEIKPAKMIINVVACGSDSALRPLGAPGRVVLTMDSDWYFGASENYINMGMQALPTQFDFVDPKGYDVNNNGYVSVRESFDTMMKSMQRWLSELTPETYIQEIVKYGIYDASNIAEKTFLGDFNVDDQC